MGVAHQLTTNGSISIVTTSYFVENLQDLFDLPITRKLEFECYKVTFWNGLEAFWKGSKPLALYLEWHNKYNVAMAPRY